MGKPRVKFVFKGKRPTPRVKFVFKGKRPSNGDTENRVQTHDEDESTPWTDETRVQTDSTQWTDDKNRQKLRQQYRHVMAEIDKKEEDLIKPNSRKFNSIVNEVNSLYEHVTTAREQVSDAEALLRMSDAIVSAAKSYSNSTLTPSRFVTCLLAKFGSSKRKHSKNNTYFSWKRLGLSVSHLFMKAHGCQTMYSPLINNNGPSSNIQTKTKKRKRIEIRPPKPVLPSQPNEFDTSQSWIKEKSKTDRIVEVMHRILRRKKREKVDVVLENLVLNRISFAQTVENLFALSFLVKDGRVEISVDDRNSHIVSTKTPPDHASVQSGKVEYSHFIFRFDFKDWMMMKDFVAVGEELMHHRIGWDEEIEDIKPKIVTVAQQSPNQDDIAMRLLPLVSVVTKA